VIELLFVLMMLSSWIESWSLFTYDTRQLQWGYDAWTRLGFVAWWYLCYCWMFFASCSPVDLCCQVIVIVIVIVIDLMFVLMMLMQASPWIESWSLFTYDTRQLQWGYGAWTRLGFVAWYLCYRWMFFASCYPVDLCCQVIVIVIELLFVLMMLMQASPWIESWSLFTYDTRQLQWYGAWIGLGFVAWYLCYRWMLMKYGSISSKY
jgi:hypothetical protein